MKISTKTGDSGRTKLVFGRDALKCSPRVRAYGALDDFSAALGLARAFAKGGEAEYILGIQKKLVFLMTELATEKDDFPKLKEKNFRLLGEGDLAEIEAEIEKLEGGGAGFDGWFHAGDTPLQAALDAARARCRSAEREIVALNEGEGLARDFPLKYVNRLSDLLMLMAKNQRG